MTGQSSARAVDLARRLKAAGARMYGAFWCSHCFEQKAAFGAAAAAELPYVECYPQGYFKVGGGPEEGLGVMPVLTACMTLACMLLACSVLWLGRGPSCRQVLLPGGSWKHTMLLHCSQLSLLHLACAWPIYAVAGGVP